MDIDSVYYDDSAPASAGCYYDDTIAYNDATPYELMQVDMADGQAIELLMNGNISEQAMMATLAKLMVLLHHNAKKCHEFNDSITKKLIKLEITNIVKTHNGYSYLACQCASGGVNIAFGLMAAQPSMAKNLGAQHVFEPLRGDITKSDAALQVSKILAKQGQNLSQPFSTLGAVADNSAQASRQEGMGNKTTLDTKHQSTSQVSGKEDDTAKAMLQLLQRIQEQKGQIAASILRG
ncbi:MAG: hypothetical protein Q8K75_00945 [Chlamydiales bacterium]|nr:hypothetical protein [Chlamydiales bacterium]